MERVELRIQDLPPLPKAFVEWAHRRGLAETIARGEKDLVEALKEWKRERQSRIEGMFRGRVSK